MQKGTSAILLQRLLDISQEYCQPPHLVNSTSCHAFDKRGLALSRRLRNEEVLRCHSRVGVHTSYTATNYSYIMRMQFSGKTTVFHTVVASSILAIRSKILHQFNGQNIGLRNRRLGFESPVECQKFDFIKNLLYNIHIKIKECI